MEFFNVDDFKKWMSSQDDGEDTRMESKLIGLEVESKLHNARRIAKNIESFDGDLHEIAVSFKEYGGRIRDVDDKLFYIETNEGSFVIHRCFVKKRS
jgi:hypothetical protein